MTASPPMKICLLASRNIGDSVIQSAYLKRLIERFPTISWLVWTRPEVAPVFTNLPRTKVVTSRFPVGTARKFGWNAVSPFLRAIQQLRREQPSYAIDFIGDFRERCMGSMLGVKRHLYIGWGPGHYCGKLNRTYGARHPLVTVPKHQGNIYQSYQVMYDGVVQFLESTGMQAAHTTEAAVSEVASDNGQTIRIGLHPFASQDCKLWPEANWRLLAERLLESGCELLAFGAPSERAKLTDIFPLHNKLTCVTEPLDHMIALVRTLDLMVGLDSFSVHVAELMGVRSLTIVGGNDPEIWVPPSGRYVKTLEQLPCHPCLNRPTCTSEAEPFRCIRNIAVAQVLQIVQEMLPQESRAN